MLQLRIDGEPRASWRIRPAQPLTKLLLHNQRMFSGAQAPRGAAARLHPQRVLGGQAQFASHLDGGRLGGHVHHAAGFLCIDDVAIRTAVDAYPAAIVPIALRLCRGGTRHRRSSRLWRRHRTTDGSCRWAIYAVRFPSSFATNRTEEADRTTLPIGHHIILFLYITHKLFTIQMHQSTHYRWGPKINEIQTTTDRPTSSTLLSETDAKSKSLCSIARGLSITIRSALCTRSPRRDQLCKMCDRSPRVACVSVCIIYVYTRGHHAYARRSWVITTRVGQLYSVRGENSPLRGKRSESPVEVCAGLCMYLYIDKYEFICY